MMSLPKLRSLLHTAAVGALLLVGACERPTAAADGAGSRTIAVNQVVAGTVRGTDAARYVVRVSQGQRVALLVQAQSGEVSASLGAPGVLSPSGFLHVRADGRPLGATSTHAFTAPRDDAYTIDVSGDGTFRLQLYVADPAPEIASRAVLVGDTVARETLYAPSDVDAFTFRGTRGDTLVALVQATDSARGGAVHVAVSDAAGKALAGASAARGETLEQRASTPFVLEGDGIYTVRVTGEGSFPDSGYAGPYRLQLRRFTAGPERTRAAASAGVTLTTEAVDHAHDVDEFVLVGAPGALYNVLLQAPAGAADTEVRVEVAGGVGSSPEPLIVYSSGRDSLLTDRGTGRFALPANGRVTVRVSGDAVGPTVAPYRLRVVAVDERPESRPATLAFGDSVLDERIEEPGDVDEFTLDVPSAAIANVVLAIPPGPDGRGARLAGAGLSIYRDGQTPGSPMTVWGPAIDEPPDGPFRTATGMFPLAAGRWRVRVAGTLPRVRSFVGAYRLYAYRVDTLPERARPALVVGDTISEAIDPPGERDDYWYDGTRGEHVEVVTLWPTAPSGLSVPAGAPYEERSGRVTFAESGRYRVTVRGMGVLNGLEHGAYRLALLRFPAAPETRRAELTPGQTVTDERLDIADDVDEFTVRGTPGSRVLARLTASEQTSGVQVELVDPTTRQVLASTPSYAGTESTAPVAFPPGGALLVRVSDSLYASRHQDPILGGYRLEVVSAP